MKTLADNSRDPRKQEVLVLTGSPGSGKTTLANKISELLTSRDEAHAVIDVDELARIHPELDCSPKWANLAAIWPNYAAIPGLGKVILPVLIDTPDDLDQLHLAVGRSALHIVELTAAESALVERVTIREPNDYWRSKLRGLAERYVERPDDLKFGDFTVDTEAQAPEQSAHEVLEKIGW